MFEQFMLWLEERGVQEQFAENFTNCDYHGPDLRGYVEDHPAPRFLLADAFKWDKTPEGSNFWTEHSVVWFGNRFEKGLN